MDRKAKKHGIAVVIALATMGVASGNAVAGGLLNVEFDIGNFSAPTVIDNPYWPLLPNGVTSRTYTYIGDGEDECVVNVISVNLGDVKMDFGGDYAGSVAQVVLDQEWVFEDVEECDAGLAPDDDALSERTFDWYMQDDQQNIWYMGELSRDFGDGCPGPEVSDDDVEDEDCFGGSWEAGAVGGEGEEAVVGVAGIVVPGDFPVAGEPLKNGTHYMQEVAFEAEDMAKILKQHTSLSVDDNDYEDCRKVKEWNPFEHGGSVEHKWYCADGPGLVLIEGIGGGPTEQEVLVDVTSTP